MLKYKILLQLFVLNFVCKGCSCSVYRITKLKYKNYICV